MRNTDTTTNSHRGSAPVPPAAHQKAEAMKAEEWNMILKAICMQRARIMMETEKTCPNDWAKAEKIALENKEYCELGEITQKIYRMNPGICATSVFE